MAITEQSRHRLRRYLEETMGEEQASAMMDHLLPVSWADLATSREVDELGREMGREFAAVRTEIPQLRDWATVRFDQIDRRFDQVDRRFDQTEARFDQMLKAELARVEARIDRGFRRQAWALVTAVCALNGLVIAALRIG